MEPFKKSRRALVLGLVLTKSGRSDFEDIADIVGTPVMSPFDPDIAGSARSHAAVKGPLRHRQYLVDALSVDIDDLEAPETVQERFASLG